MSIRGIMHNIKYLNNVRPNKTKDKINVVSLLKKAKLESKKEKNKNLVITAVAISALAAAGFVIVH
jgi:hypothetical protein